MNLMKRAMKGSYGIGLSYNMCHLIWEILKIWLCANPGLLMIETSNAHEKRIEMEVVLIGPLTSFAGQKTF